MALKVLPFKIPKPKSEALIYQEYHEIVFYDHLHQHEEIQISYIVQGSGSLIVGDSINCYKPNDILVIGENIPHVFRSDSTMTTQSIMYTLFFTRRSFGNDFFNISDLLELNDFFKDSTNGLKLLSHQSKIIKKFRKLRNSNRVERIATLLKVLNLIQRADKKQLSSFVYRKKYSDAEGKRMYDVFQYAMDHFKNPLSLEEISEKANMSKNAFCRYFKKRTNKTFFQFVIEMRIEYACKLLYRERELPVALISELCGFQNIGNFNRKFKELKNMTPSQYKCQFLK